MAAAIIAFGRNVVRAPGSVEQSLSVPMPAQGSRLSEDSFDSI